MLEEANKNIENSQQERIKETSGHQKEIEDLEQHVQEMKDKVIHSILSYLQQSSYYYSS